MSMFMYVDEDRDSLMIQGIADAKDVYIEVAPRAQVSRSVRVDFADVPAVAAELLKAAGHHYLAGYIEGGIDVQERAEKAEAEAAEKKLQERRDALAKKYHGLDFVHIGEGGQRVINDIIELQDKLNGASRD